MTHEVSDIGEDLGQSVPDVPGAARDSRTDAGHNPAPVHTTNVLDKTLESVLDRLENFLPNTGLAADTASYGGPEILDRISSTREVDLKVGELLEGVRHVVKHLEILNPVEDARDAREVDRLRERLDRQERFLDDRPQQTERLSEKFNSLGRDLTDCGTQGLDLIDECSGLMLRVRFRVKDGPLEHELTQALEKVVNSIDQTNDKVEEFSYHFDGTDQNEG